jgi:multidrug efflux pump subunit AcrB
MRDIAFRLAQVVAAHGRARQVNFDWIEPGRKVRIRIDQDQARLLGLTSDTIAGVLNTVMRRPYSGGRCRTRSWAGSLARPF